MKKYKISRGQMYVERSEFRENELLDRFDNLGINYKYMDSSLCVNYIKFGGNVTADEICNQILHDRFFEKYTSYKKLLNEYNSNKTINEKIIIEIKFNALKEYVINNQNNIHKILNEIPWTLKKDIDIVFDYIEKEQLNEQLNEQNNIKMINQAKCVKI